MPEKTTEQSALVRDAEQRRIANMSNPFHVVEDPPRDKIGRSVFDLFDDGRPVQQTLDIGDLTATQRAFDAKKVQALASTKKSFEPINVVRMNGRLYVTDGHHRAIAALLRGDRTIRADVVMAEG